ncbi:WD40 repeat-like protein [Hysterangium stoloniferum]|nr:WD40 repeat-like protein [Hysterangium stoloniferum]
MSVSLQAGLNLKTLTSSSTIVSHGSYIVSLALTVSSNYAALATKSTESAQGNAILLYSLSSTGLAHSKTLSVSDGSVPTSMRVVPNFSGRSSLMSAHEQNGGIKVWDERKVHAPKNRNILSFDLSSDGNMLAAGTDLQSDDASIFYWDPRNPSKPLHTHSSTHSDDITTLHFHPTMSHVLLSASTDGLLSTSSAAEPDEDEAIQEVANWGCSISRAGWYSRGSPTDYGVWAASDMETFGLWSDNLDLLSDFGNIRQPSLTGRWTTDYLIDAYDSYIAPGPFGASGLTLLLGSNSGDVAVASVPESSDARHTWSIKGILEGGHSDAVVRSVIWDRFSGVLVTGDEEGRITAWRTPIRDVDIGGDVEMEDIQPARVGSKRPRDGDRNEGTKRGRYDG